MAEFAKKQATYHDVLRAPEHMVAEIVGGELHLQPRPAKPHSAAVSALSEELGPPFKRGRGGPGGWIILFEPELHVGADIVVPDLAGWRRERMPVMTDELPYFELAPDWICEVLSPSTYVRDRVHKLKIYAREQVNHVWLVDPLQQTLEVLRRVDHEWLIVDMFHGNVLIRAEPFAAIELNLGIVWADVVLSR